MSDRVFFRIPDAESEPPGQLIDSADISCPFKMRRLLELIPVFNMMLPFWRDSRMQLDTMLKCMQNIGFTWQIIDDFEKKGRLHANARYINADEEISLIPIKPLKEMLAIFGRYQNATQINIWPDDYKYIREYLFEFVRKSRFHDKNGRFNSVFLYENLGVAVQIDKEYKAGVSSTLCQVRTVEVRSLDRYDVQWLTALTPGHICNDYFRGADNYWSGRQSASPKAEILFSGKYVLQKL